MDAKTFLKVWFVCCVALVFVVNNVIAADYFYGAYKGDFLGYVYTNDTVLFPSGSGVTHTYAENWCTSHGKGTFKDVMGIFYFNKMENSWEYSEASAANPYTYTMPTPTAPYINVSFAIVCGDGYDYYPMEGGYYTWHSGLRPSAPTSSFSVSPSSDTNYYPVNVTFTSTSSGDSPLSYIWKIDGITNSTSSSFSYIFESAGTYNVSLFVSNSYGNSTSYQNYIVKEYVLPSCSYEFSVLQGTSPLYVSFTDTSTGSPTSYDWNFDLDDYPWIDVSPSKLNETANPVVTYTGSGIGYIYHSVTNPAGTSICSLQGYNLSGVVPTPTPTPPVPFPNQTGVCQNQQLSLGSSLTRAFDVVGEIIEPDGNSYNVYFPAGETALFTGNYAQEIGQYYYSEKNTSQQLLYQMSYVVEDCITYSPTSTYTVMPTYSRTIIPTNTPIIPTTTIQIDDNLNDTFVMPIQTFATMEPTRNTSGDVNITKVREDITSLNPAFVPYMDFTDSIFYPFYTFFINVITPFVTLFGFVNTVNWVLSTFTLMMAGLNDVMYLSLVSLNLAISNIPIKVQNVITFCLMLDFLAQVRDLKSGRRL